MDPTIYSGKVAKIWAKPLNFWSQDFLNLVTFIIFRAHYTAGTMAGLAFAMAILGRNHTNLAFHLVKLELTQN